MVVRAASEAGLPAVRARGSDGRSLGHSETVDVLVGNMRAQVKTRAKLAEFLTPPEGTDGVVLVESRRGSKSQMFAVLRLADLLELLARSGGWK